MKKKILLGVIGILVLTVVGVVLYFAFLYKIDLPKESIVFRHFSDDHVIAMSISVDGRYLAYSTDYGKFIVLRDLSNGTDVLTYDNPYRTEDLICCFHPNRPLIAVQVSMNSIKFVNDNALDKPSEIGVFKRIRAAQFSPRGDSIALVTGKVQLSVEFFSLDNQQLRTRYDSRLDSGEQFCCAAYSSDGNTFCLVHGAVVTLISPVDGTAKEMPIDLTGVRRESVTISASNRYVVCPKLEDKMCRVFDIRDRKFIDFKINCEKDQKPWKAFVSESEADSRLIVISCGPVTFDSSLSIIAWKGPTDIRPMRLYTDAIGRAEFAPLGNRLAVTSFY